MKLTLATITNPNFVQAVGRLVQLPLKTSQAYWLSKALRVFDAETRDFEAARIATLKTYGKEEGNEYKIENPEDRDKANAAITELLNREVEVTLPKIDLPPQSTITTVDCLVLEEILAEPTEK